MFLRCGGLAGWDVLRLARNLAFGCALRLYRWRYGWLPNVRYLGMELEQMDIETGFEYCGCCDVIQKRTCANEQVRVVPLDGAAAHTYSEIIVSPCHGESARVLKRKTSRLLPTA